MTDITAKIAAMNASEDNLYARVAAEASILKSDLKDGLISQADYEAGCSRLLAMVRVEEASKDVQHQQEMAEALQLLAEFLGKVL